MFTVKKNAIIQKTNEMLFKNISCLRLRKKKQKEKAKVLIFKNISCLRLSLTVKQWLLNAANLKTFHVYG